MTHWDFPYLLALKKVIGLAINLSLIQTTGLTYIPLSLHLGS